MELWLKQRNNIKLQEATLKKERFLWITRERLHITTLKMPNLQKEKTGNAKWNQESDAWTKWEYQQRYKNYKEEPNRNCGVFKYTINWKNSLEIFDNKLDEAEGKKKSVNIKKGHLKW